MEKRITASSPVKRKPAGRGTARNAALVNLFVTPGFGSLMGGRILEGLGQLILAVAGFTLVMIWFVNVMVQYYGMINGQETPFHSRAWLGIAGILTFGVAWLWALATSIVLMREAQRNEVAEQQQESHRSADDESK